MTDPFIEQVTKFKHNMRLQTSKSLKNYKVDHCVVKFVKQR